MNTKINFFLLIILLFSIHQNRCTSPLSNISFTFSTATKISLLENLPRLIREYPFVSTFIAALISLVGYKKFFNGSNSSSQEPAKSSNQTKYNENIIITKNNVTNDFTLTLFNNEKKYQFPSVYSYEISPKNNYLLLCQLEEVPVIELLGRIIFNKIGFKGLSKSSIQLFPVIKLIDIQSGKEIQSFENAQCFFDKDEDVLLIREPKKTSNLKQLFNRILRMTQLFQEKLIPADQCELIDMMQYRLFNIKLKKNILLLENIRSASFDHKGNLLVVNAQGDITKYKKNISSSFISKINPFSSLMYYCAKNSPQKKYNLDYKLEYFFNRKNKTYSLRVTDKKNQIFTYNNVINFTQKKNYLLISTKSTKRNAKTIDTLQEITEYTAEMIFDNFIQMLESPQFVTQLIDVSTGNTILNFEYENPILCSFVPNSEDIIIIERNPISYKLFNLNTHTTRIANKAESICFNKNITFTILNDQQKPASTEQVISIREVGEHIDQLATNAFSSLKKVFAPAPKNKIKTVPNNLFIEVFNKIPYNTYFYVGEKLSSALDKKKSTLKPLNQGVRGFEWNIHPFSLSLPKFIKPKNAQKPTICISNNDPKDMSYYSFKSLQGELAKILIFMKQEEKNKDNNDKAIISLFLNNNNCSSKTIDSEISKVLTTQKYDPLLKPTEPLIWPTLGQMITDKTRLVIFSTADTNTQNTFSIKYAPYHLHAFFHEKAASNSQLFTIANKLNQQYLKANPIH